MEPIRVLLKVLSHGEGLETPAYATMGSSGCDLRAAIVMVGAIGLYRLVTI